MLTMQALKRQTKQILGSLVSHLSLTAESWVAKRDSVSKFKVDVS